MKSAYLPSLLLCSHKMSVPTRAFITFAYLVMERSHSNITLPSISIVLFWVCVLLYFMISSNIQNYAGGYPHLFFSTAKIVIFQIIAAYVCIEILIPKFLNKKRTKAFVFWLIVLLILLFIGYNIVQLYLYQPAFIQYYSERALEYAKDPLLIRLMNFDVFLSKSIKFLTPTAVLVMFQFYKNQQQLLQLKEQKKTAELEALKHQLNPHFLFNTLNNLYSLALEKSDKTPEVIERLSEILDYILFQCKDDYVALSKEVELIENYLALEKVRYGDRVFIEFTHSIRENAKIAPLILLTFIENAFKHGVKQALNNARIDIHLSTDKNTIQFDIKNSKPLQSAADEKEQLGLKNVKKQLALLYPNAHELIIEDEADSYRIVLTLNPNLI